MALARFPPLRTWKWLDPKIRDEQRPKKGDQAANVGLVIDNNQFRLHALASHFLGRYISLR